MSARIIEAANEDLNFRWHDSHLSQSQVGTSDLGLSASDLLFEFTRIHPNSSSIRRSFSVLHSTKRFIPGSDEFRAYSSLPHGYDANCSAFLRSLANSKRNSTNSNIANNILDDIEPKSGENSGKSEKLSIDNEERISGIADRDESVIDAGESNANCVKLCDLNKKRLIDNNDTIISNGDDKKVDDNVAVDKIVPVDNDKLDDVNVETELEDVERQDKKQNCKTKLKNKAVKSVKIEQLNQPKSQQSVAKSKSSKRNARRRRFNSLSPTRSDNLKKHVQQAGRKKSNSGKRYTSLSDPNRGEHEIPDDLKIGGEHDVDNMPRWAKIILKGNKTPNVDSDYCASSSDERRENKDMKKHKIAGDGNASEKEEAAEASEVLQTDNKNNEKYGFYESDEGASFLLVNAESDEGASEVECISGKILKQKSLEKILFNDKFKFYESDEEINRKRNKSLPKVRFDESDDGSSDIAEKKTSKTLLLVNSESDDSCGVTSGDERVKSFRRRFGGFDTVAMRFGDAEDSDQSVAGGNLNFASESMEDLPYSALDDDRLDGMRFKKIKVKNAEHMTVSVPTTPTAAHGRRIRTISSEITASPSSYNRLVFLTSSDSSSKEEDFDNDCECDWDYFEPSSSIRQEGSAKPPSLEQAKKVNECDIDCGELEAGEDVCDKSVLGVADVTSADHKVTEETYRNVKLSDIKETRPSVENNSSKDLKFCDNTDSKSLCASESSDSSIVVSSSSSVDYNESQCCKSCGSRPKYIPVPIPVPVPVPVPWWGPRESLVLFRNAIPRSLDTSWMWSAPTVSSNHYGQPGTSFYPSFTPGGGWMNGFENSMYQQHTRMPLIAPSLMDYDRHFGGGFAASGQDLGAGTTPAHHVTTSTSQNINTSDSDVNEIHVVTSSCSSSVADIGNPTFRETDKELDGSGEVRTIFVKNIGSPDRRGSSPVLTSCLSDRAQPEAETAEPDSLGGDEHSRSMCYFIEEDSLTVAQSHLECENEGSSSSESETSDSDDNTDDVTPKNRLAVQRSYDITREEEKEEDGDSSVSSYCSSEGGKKKFTKIFTVNPYDEESCCSEDEFCSEIACANDCAENSEIVLLSCTQDPDSAPPASAPGVGATGGGSNSVRSGVSESESSLSPANGSTNTHNASAKYKSLVMITQCDRRQPTDDASVVSVVTPDVTVRHTNNDDGGGVMRVDGDVTVRHTSNNMRVDGDVKSEVSTVKDGEVRVVSNCDALAAVICLEEGLADDDSWVEDVGSHDDEDDFATTTATESDSGGEDALMAMLLSQQSDREEELRGYHRAAIDFTLHTIAEESCEESETESKKPQKQRPMSSSDLEKYFFFGLCGEAGNLVQSGSNSNAILSNPNLDEDNSETSSVYSEGVDSVAGDEENVNSLGNNEESPERLASSRLEKYFLSGFMGFTERRESDGSGSVGSDSEGRPSPEQRRKRLVRARGTGRSSHSSSLDNLLVDQNAEVAQQPQQQQQQQLLVNVANELAQQQSSQDSSESDGGNNEEGISFDKDGSFDTVKRKQKHAKKNKHETSTSNDDWDMTQQKDDEDNRSRTPQPEFLNMSPADLAMSRNKQHSRDSGFIGSCDDLLKEQKGAGHHGDEQQNKVEQLAEIAEENSSRLEENDGKLLSRKDSFNNWSSDEETNMMMCKMRQFFKTMVAGRGSNAQNSAQKTNKSPQLLYFESELTRLMKTVPGIREDQVREIVEYLSSEDTWSDSCDSSDYTSSDLEGAMDRTALRRQISDSCRRIISKFDSNAAEDEEGDAGDGGVVEEARETAFIYQKLVQSFGNESQTSKLPVQQPLDDSSPLIAKVMHHIGSRLVALMQEVSSSGGESHASASPRVSKHHHHYHRRSQHKPPSTTEDDDEEDSLSLPRSKSHDPLLADQVVPADEREASDYERFSWRGSFESALMTGADSRTKLSLLSENSQSAVALAAKRRSAGDLLFGRKSPGSRERLDRVRSCGSIGRVSTDWSEGSEDMEQPKNRRLSVPDSTCGSSSDNDDQQSSNKRSTTLPRSLAPQQSASSNSLPRQHQFLQNNSGGNVKSARYRAPGFAGCRASASGGSGPKRAGSAPGLQQQTAPPRREPRRRMAHSQSPAHHQQLVSQDDGSVSANSSPLSRLRTAGGQPRDLGQDWTGIHDDDVTGISSASDRMLRLHSNRSLSSLGLRSDSMASVYSGAGDGRYGTVAVKGEVEFGLQYNYKTDSLMIRIKQCRDLAQVDAKRSRSDPYVKVYLLPDKSKSGKRKTKVKKHTVNPVFEETLSFNLSLEELKARTLWLSVWHSDMFGRNDFLGEVMMPLEDKVFDDPAPVWYPLQERTEPFEESINNKGDIILAMKFVPPGIESTSNGKLKSKKSKGSLHVLVKEAKNLTAAKANGTSDPFCKSYLLPDKGRSSKQKTPVIRRCLNPAWNYTFVYDDVTLQDLHERALELTVWDHDRLGSNEFLGMIRLSLGTGKFQEKQVEWMDSHDREMALWKSMLDRPNFWVEGCISLRNSNMTHNKV